MDGMLSQDEINALLSGMSLNNEASEPKEETKEQLNDAEKDALGEVANISMGTAATTLSSLLNQKVTITTPRITYSTWDEVALDYVKPCVLLRISYVEGLTGNNVLILKEDDVKIITDLMMGGPGNINDEPLGELHLSAIGEAMNQMMGSAATSMSSMLNKKIDISPPVADLVDLSSEEKEKPSFVDDFVKISFDMKIGELIDSQIMQLYPVDFAKDLYNQFIGSMTTETVQETATPQQAQPAQPAQPVPQAPQPAPQPTMQQAPQQAQPAPQPVAQTVNVAPASFTPFSGEYEHNNQPENIGLIMDVPLEVTVELGRTKKSIKEILDFAPGAIIELNKIAGEPVDVLVNGKLVAKGEVVVIEESFGVRVSEIVGKY